MNIITEFAMAQKGQRFSPRTIENRIKAIQNLQQYSGAPAIELTHHHIRAYLGRDSIQASSAQTERSHIKAFYKFIQAEGYRNDDPTQKVAPVRAPRHLPRPFTREQIEAMLNSGCYLKTRAMILLGYFQGLRRSEIASFHTQQIDFPSNTVHITGKGGKRAILPLRPEIRELSKRMPRDDYWFPSGDKHIAPASVSDIIRRAKIRAGIRDPHLTAHSLRHSYGSELLENGVDVRIVQELMRHESLSSTERYTKVSNRRKVEGISYLPTITIPDRSGRKIA